MEIPIEIVKYLPLKYRHTSGEKLPRLQLLYGSVTPLFTIKLIRQCNTAI